MIKPYIITCKSEFRGVLDLYLVLNEKHYIDILISFKIQGLFFRSPYIFGAETWMTAASEMRLDYETKRYQLRSMNKLIKDLNL